MSESYALIRQAILEKRQIVATYNGHHRELCPHVIGTTKDGRPQALFFQFAGTSSSGLPPGGDWRCIPIDGLEEVVMRPGNWHTAPNYPGPQTCVDVIDVEVSNEH
jgi:hypothetical protein